MSARSGLVMILAMLVADPALALAQRTFVSGLGVDTNPCSIAAPCRSFDVAIGKTIAGGEVLAIDSAGYGPVTITQSVSITAAPGVYAGISVSAAADTGIKNSAANTGVVVLRGLSINSTGGTVGIQYNGVGLTVEDCSISGFNYGIVLLSTVATIRNTVITGSGLTAVYIVDGKTTLEKVLIDRAMAGIELKGAFGTAMLAMRSSTISNVADGVLLSANAKASLDGVTINLATDAGVLAKGDAFGGQSDVQIIRSQVVNSLQGVVSLAPAGGGSLAHVTDSLVARNVLALKAGPVGKLTVSHSTIVSNAVGINSVGSSVSTTQDNPLADNTIQDIQGTLPPVALD